MFRWACLLCALLALTACVRRDGRNSDCHWPGTAPGQTLNNDVEYAEELAVRYMDAHAGPRDPEAAARAKNTCMGTLMRAIGKDRGITPQEAFREWNHRSLAVDLAINLPLLLLYALAAAYAVHRLKDKPLPILIIASVVISILAVLLVQQWETLAESLRVGTSHLSNRALRLPASQNPLLFFAIALATFWATRLVQSRKRYS